MNTETLKFKITGERKMYCGGCSAAVETPPSELDGVQHVRADHDSQRILIELSRSTDSDQPFIDELRKLGYQAHGKASAWWIVRHQKPDRTLC